MSDDETGHASDSSGDDGEPMRRGSKRKGNGDRSDDDDDDDDTDDADKDETPAPAAAAAAAAAAVSTRPTQKKRSKQTKRVFNGEESLLLFKHFKSLGWNATKSDADANIMGVLGITSKQLRSWATNQRFRHVNFKAVNYYHHFINNLELTKPLKQTDELDAGAGAGAGASSGAASGTASGSGSRKKARVSTGGETPSGSGKSKPKSSAVVTYSRSNRRSGASTRHFDDDDDDDTSAAAEAAAAMTTVAAAAGADSSSDAKGVQTVPVDLNLDQLFELYKTSPDKVDVISTAARGVERIKQMEEFQQSMIARAAERQLRRQALADEIERKQKELAELDAEADSDTAVQDVERQKNELTRELSEAVQLFVEAGLKKKKLIQLMEEKKTDWTLKVKSAATAAAAVAAAVATGVGEPKSAPSAVTVPVPKSASSSSSASSAAAAVAAAAGGGHAASAAAPVAAAAAAPVAAPARPRPLPVAAPAAAAAGAAPSNPDALIPLHHGDVG